jgi:hypothetical protein
MNTKTFSTELADHREALSTLANQIDTLSSQLDDLKNEMDGEVISADELIEADQKRTADDRKIRSTHYRMLALLDHYGTMHRDHIAGIMGVKSETIGQYTHIVKHHGLADLQSRKGRVTLFSLADGVRENNHFRT